MGFLGPYKCALCGRSCMGLRWTIKNGKELCGQCHDRLEKEMPYDKWHRMTITQIREYFADKEMLDSRTECAFCGSKLGKDEAGRMVLKDKNVICGKCAESMRIVKPVYMTIEPDGYDDYKDVAEDPMKELTLDDVPWVQKDAAEEREKRIAKYGRHKAVFIVDDVTRYFKEPDAHQVYGRVVLGRIDRDDTLCVRRREGTYRKLVTWIDPLEYNKKAKCLSEGHEGNLMILGDVSFIYPGDVLTVEKA